ncbi:hypothetical protein RFEPED_1096 [Rickettsia felis str. Pedreira]|uniref:Toxin-antitoxin system, antitoxin component n=2 Tax=Rickettsia felis TaxID=42862 RepID=A0A0F3MVX0_RICFI|nr:DUF6290 family protein [Rickettsia felis]AAY62124.1 unknown [Rickettsia felis URRWXCal2]KHO02298.1 hypothetical protein JS55_07295 [Rickettsia felis str. LSU]KHO02650.1 hypothetical protein JS61_07025 [Rickettsia felis]KJV58704.1 hypothetical protein RFEPED_1096 [Rickettsia felis str. Pedreira]MDE8610701.1 DUF6290 family protein [Rickettsia felis]
MPKSPRVNVTFEPVISTLLSNLAVQENKSLSSLVRELTLEALEMREDLFLSKVAKKLDKENAKTYSHEEAWK